MRKTGLPWIADENTRVIVLGSMPGDESLRQQRYYANPRNQFWQIIYSLFNKRKTGTNYEARIQLLRDVRIGLWDVLRHCERDGSSDSSIRSCEVNAFSPVYRMCPHLRALAFNGAKAAKQFGKALFELPTTIEMVTLPSSSGAHAKRVEQKITEWRKILNFLK